MEPKALYGFVLLIILVGFVIGVGVLAVDKFGETTETTSTVTNETFAGVNGTAVALANDELLSVTAVRNATAQGDTFNADTEYTVALDAGTITVLNGTASYTVDYTHSSDTTTTAVTDDLRTEIAAIASTWLGLIITIFVLALIIGMIIGSFGFRRD